MAYVPTLEIALLAGPSNPERAAEKRTHAHLTVVGIAGLKAFGAGNAEPRCWLPASTAAELDQRIRRCELLVAPSATAPGVSYALRVTHSQCQI